MSPSRILPTVLVVTIALSCNVVSPPDEKKEISDPYVKLAIIRPAGDTEFVETQDVIVFRYDGKWDILLRRDTTRQLEIQGFDSALNAPLPRTSVPDNASLIFNGDFPGAFSKSPFSTDPNTVTVVRCDTARSLFSLAVDLTLRRGTETIRVVGVLSNLDIELRNKRGRVATNFGWSGYTPGWYRVPKDVLVIPISKGESIGPQYLSKSVSLQLRSPSVGFRKPDSLTYASYYETLYQGMPGTEIVRQDLMRTSETDSIVITRWDPEFRYVSGWFTIQGIRTTFEDIWFWRRY